MNKIELTNCDCEILKQQNAFIMNNDLFQKYYEMRPIDCQYCNMFGKKIPVPRRCKSYGANYKFNGSSDNEKTEPFDESMELMSEIIAKSLNCEKPNNCLVNSILFIFYTIPYYFISKWFFNSIFYLI